MKRRINIVRYTITCAGLLSAFVAFGSVWYAFIVGLLTFLITTALQQTISAHFAAYIHALPTEEMDPAAWVGLGFGESADPSSGRSLLAIAVIVTDRAYAHQMHDLVLRWTGGEHIDALGNVCASIIILDPTQYIFLLFPNLHRRAARLAFDRARERLRETSLEDEVRELHAAVVFGKRCHVAAASPFPQFAKNYRDGDPVVLRFATPEQGNVRVLDELPAIVVHAFKMRQKQDLTRKDIERDAIRPFETGGEWQGPTDQRPVGS